MKVVHYAAKTINTIYSIKWESILSELVITFLLITFSAMGYAATIPLMFYGCGLSALVILVTLAYSGFTHLYYELRSERDST